MRGRKGAPEPNAIDIVLNVPADGLRARLKRNFVMSSSCGVCGKTSIDSIRRRVAPPSDSARVAPAILLTLSEKLRAGQRVFAATGGLHGAAIFSLDGTMVAIREDVGRHNAVDKVIGFALTNATVPLAHHLMMVSGRVSFEIVQKAAAAGVPILAAVSAPSSLAVELAEEIGTTLVGFLRDGSLTSTRAPIESSRVSETDKYDLTIYERTAWYYSRYRPVYPPSLVTLLRDRFELDGTGRLLDCMRPRARRDSARAYVR